MRSMVLLVLLSASSCYAQLPATGPGAQGPTALPQTPSDQTATITIPAGTIIPAKLVTQITAKARPGDPVRAVTTFPVTVGAQTVIPVGTYLDGVIETVNKRAPTVDMRFNELVFANGYTVPIAGEKSEEKAADSYPVTAASDPVADMPIDLGSGPYVNFAFDQEGSFPPPPPPSLPKMHSHLGTAIGIAVGIMVASLVAVLLLGHHRGNGEAVLFDAGWPFEIVLTQPASVDAATVAGILAAPSSY